jgi:hypothetical protein
LFIAVVVVSGHSKLHRFFQLVRECCVQLKVRNDGRTIHRIKMIDCLQLHTILLSATEQLLRVGRTDVILNDLIPQLQQ